MAELQLQVDNAYEAKIAPSYGSVSYYAINNNRQQRSRKSMEIGKKILKKYLKLQGRKKFRKYWRRHSMKMSTSQIGSSSEEKTQAPVQEVSSHVSQNILVSLSSTKSATSSFSTIKNTTNNEGNSLKTLALVPLDQRAVVTTQDCLYNIVARDTRIIFTFQQRKAFSQMDFSQARRMQNSPITTVVKHAPPKNQDNDMTLKKFVQPSEAMLNDKQSPYDLDKMYSSDNFYYALHETDSRISGMRVFATIMLNAWRKRRNEVKRLVEEINEMKRMSVKTKNQLHVFSTLFRVEQKRSDELNAQLKRSLEDINLTKNSCEGLTTSLISVKADKALLEQQLHIKEQEYEDLNTMYTQAKTELFNAMGQQRELQSNLSVEQRKVQQLENQKNELINEIFELNSEFTEKEKNLLDVIKVQEDELDALKKTLKDIETKANMFKDSREALLKNHLLTEEKLQKEVELLQFELSELQARLDITLKDKMKGYWNKSLTYQQTLFQIIHCFVYCLLPSTPPPQMYPISFNICLKKALSVIKR